MVSVQPSSVSPEAVDVVITFRSRDSPIYVLVDAVNHWEPQLMNASNGEAYEHVITVPRSTTSILYKFRVGESKWVHDEGVHTEPDNFGGWNNRFEIPELPEQHATAPSDFSDDTELESTLGVESIADTVSEYDEPVEFVDVRDVEDPEFPSASTDTPSSEESSLQRWLGYGVRSKY